MLPVIQHLGNVYSASSPVTLDERQSNNDTTEINGIIHRPDSITLSKDEPGDPTLLEIFGKTLQIKKKVISTKMGKAEFLIYRN